MKIKTKNIKAIIRNDIRLLKKSKQVYIPMILIPILFVTIIPILMVYGQNIPGNNMMLNNYFLKNLPESINNAIIGYAQQQKMIILMLKYFMAPLFSIIPLIAVNFIAADSIAGEKERKTLEAIKYAPISFKELFLGKIASIMCITMFITTISFILYCLVSNTISMINIKELILPNIAWILICFYITPLLCFFGIGFMIIVSAKAKGFREAQQMGGFIVLPPIIFTIIQSFGVMVLGIKVLLLLGIAILLIDILIYKLGVKVFHNNLYNN